MSAPSGSGRLPPWGIAASFAWLVLSFLVSAVVATMFFALWQGDRLPTGATYDGVLITIGALSSIPAQIGVLAWAAHLRGWQPLDYFAVNWPKRGELIVAVICVVVIDLAFDGLLYVTGRDIVAPFQVESYRTAQNAGWLFWLMVAIILAAPLGEELAFRGFLFRGLARPGFELHAIGIISVVWALLHIQYDWLGMAQIFVLGMVLGWFRWASGSTTLTIIMHVLINLEAMIETAIQVEYLS
jgi:CAAX protease family protein